jgi:hypothetical protein
MKQRSTRSSKVRVIPAPRHSFCNGYAPDEMFVTFEYTDVISASAAANTYSYQWRANSLFDPNYTATGSQPVGFDEVSALYRSYLVYSADIETTLTCADTAGVALVATAENPAYLNTIVLGGTPGCRVGATVKNGPPAKFKTHVDVAKVYGLQPGSIDGNTDYISSVSANPTKAVYWNVAFDTTGATDVCTIVQKIRYHARMFQRQTLNISLFSPVASHEAAVGLANRRASSTAPAICCPKPPACTSTSCPPASPCTCCVQGRKS